MLTMHCNKDTECSEDKTAVPSVVKTESELCVYTCVQHTFIQPMHLLVIDFGLYHRTAWGMSSLIKCPIALHGLCMDYSFLAADTYYKTHSTCIQHNGIEESYLPHRHVPSDSDALGHCTVSGIGLYQSTRK